MISLDHVIEVALLVLVAYLLGCTLGYLAHIALRIHASRPRFESRLAAQVAANIRAETMATAPDPAPVAKSAARRLAGSVETPVSPPTAIAPTQQRPPDLPSPRGGKADDLRQVKGIGAKTESALHDLGIYHLDQIAAWTSVHIDWLEGRIAVKGRIRREQWVEQAILLTTATVPA